MTQTANSVGEGLLAHQRKDFLAAGPPGVKTRIDRLRRAHDLLGIYEQKICDALMSDYGHRSKDQTFFVELMTTAKPLRLAMKQVKKWMRPERRSAGFPFNAAGARAEVRYEPLGTVGIISPWNFPINLTFTPLAGVLAAGNRAMIKPSEHTPATSELMKQMFASAFDETEIAVVTGGPDVAASFSALPFDHLLYTGGEVVAKSVMRAAADNLVPLTLELGGKSPVILGTGANLRLAADRIMFGKLFNAGQVCLSPDYLFVAEQELENVVEALLAAAEKMAPAERDASDLVSIINDRHAQRLTEYVREARETGARVLEIEATGGRSEAQKNVVPVTLIINPEDSLTAMREEIFGPILPIKTYKNLDEIVGYLADQPPSLALYYFGNNKADQDKILAGTRSGGVTINDVVMHYTVDDLPFGGVGSSGMGAYHGFDGFKQFSHARAIYRQSRFDVAGLLRPPYGPAFHKFSRFLFKHG